ncbi:hypothetical protein ACLMJK_000494 [Lecanora helva]
MESVVDRTASASEYPRKSKFRDIHSFMLNDYFEKLNELNDKLFHGAHRASMEFWECLESGQPFKEAVRKNHHDIKQQFRVGEATEQLDPICRFIEAALGEKLTITREMLTVTLCYHQILPCFLDFLFPFARDLYASDSHFGGLRSHTRFSAEDRGLRIPNRGWSGFDIKICYNLKSVGHDKAMGPRAWPWFTGQSAVHHSFDIETGQTSWIVVTGDQQLRHRIKSATGDQAVSGRSFCDREQAFVSTLAVHLILCEWSGQTWRWYINFLDKKIQSSTKSAVSSLLENPPSHPDELGRGDVRQRHGRQRNHNVQEVMGSSSALPSVEYRATSDTGFSFSDLQGAYAVEEIVNNANLLLKVNHDVLAELREAYKYFERCPGWPLSLSENCREILIRFDKRIARIQYEIATEQSRVEKLLRLIADRKSLINGILDQQNIQLGKQQAEQAQRSAWRMEEMTSAMQDLTRDMDNIARETREETTSMRIMALIALLYLPGTFASVRHI